MTNIQKPSLQDVQPERRDRKREILVSLYASRRDGEREEKKDRGGARRKKVLRFGLLFFGGVVFFGGVLYMASMFSALRYAHALGKQWYADIVAGARAMSTFDIEAASRSFTSAQETFGRLYRLDQQYRFTGIVRTAGFVLPKEYRGIQEAPETLRLVREAHGSVAGIVGALKSMKEDGMKYLFSKQGQMFLNDLERMVLHIGVLRNTFSDLQANVARLPARIEQVSFAQEKMYSEFVAANIMLTKSELFLDTLVRLLKSAQGSHIAVIFQNPSEIRATGGFIGSYADVALDKGAVSNLDVVDIYDPDGQRDEAIIPPEPLRGITTEWGARDANWFFDFPTSMIKFLELLEASKIYEERGVVFQGVVAVNTKVIEDILGIVGPVAMPEYEYAITRENFLSEIQKEVETGDDKYVRGEPKRILKVLAPRLLERMGALSEEEGKELLRALVMRANNKDIQVYMRNPVMQTFIESAGLAGSLYNTSFGFSGDYLGVVNSNIAGGKSDAFMKQKVRVESRIDERGTVTNRLFITRTHTGNKQKYSWYRAANQNFIRVYVPPRADLSYAKGFSKKRVYDAVDYNNPRYTDDALLVSLERGASYLDEYYADVYHEGDKRVFGMWFHVIGGQTRTLEMEYILRDRARLGNGVQHAFVLEKQSGVDSEYEIVFHAPIGYYWLESGNAEYLYNAPEVFSREIVKLTMVKR